MYVNKALVDNAECKLEDLIQVGDSVVDTADGTICDNLNNIWRNLRQEESQRVDNMIRLENEVSHAVNDHRDDIPTLSDEVGYHGRQVTQVGVDNYMEGISIGFSL